MSNLLRNRYSNSSRRDFLRTAAGAGGAMLIGPACWNASAEGVDPRLAQVLSETIGTDMHNHVYPAGTEPHPQHGPQDGPPQRPQEQQAGYPNSLSGKRTRAVRGTTRSVRDLCSFDFAPNEKPGNAQASFLGWLNADRQCG